MAIFQKIAAVVIAALTTLANVTGYFGLEVTTEDYKTYKNVILMIGDGMGENHLKTGKQALGIEELNMESMPIRGQSKTNSLFWQTTDSAAGASALACGIRNFNGMISTYGLDPLSVFANPKSVSEVAKDLGKAVGVVTTDETSGATPSAFSAHTYSRSNTEIITEQQLASNLDLIWGGGNGLVNEENAAANGFTFIDTATELAAFDGSTKSFGQFDFDDLKNITNNHDTPHLEALTEKAIDVLSQDEDGFFLMIEGACIDKHSHSNEMEGMIKSLNEFDNAIQVALDFAEEDGETLVIVTADHETGGITYDEANDSYYFTSGSHTNANVPLFVSESDAGFVNGAAYKNRHIGAQIGLILGAEKGSFPCAK